MPQAQSRCFLRATPVLPPPPLEELVATASAPLTAGQWFPPFFSGLQSGSPVGVYIFGACLDSRGLEWVQRGQVTWKGTGGDWPKGSPGPRAPEEGRQAGAGPASKGSRSQGRGQADLSTGPFRPLHYEAISIVWVRGFKISHKGLGTKGVLFQGSL